MDYVVGSVAALISGNVTPNRPRILKRALTPTKHQPSPNVTPKSEFVEDRSIFLSPTLQKKKAIVKKSPKRIFQNPDSDATLDEGEASITSPKADKVKKHLKEDLESSDKGTNVTMSPRTPKKKLNKSTEDLPANNDSNLEDSIIKTVASNESTPKKKKKGNKSNIVSNNSEGQNLSQVSLEENSSVSKSPNRKGRKNKQKKGNIKSKNDEKVNNETDISEKNPPENNHTPKDDAVNMEIDTTNPSNSKKKTNKKRKKNKKNKPSLVVQNQVDNNETTKQASNDKLNKNAEKVTQEDEEDSSSDSNEFINPNAITTQDTDSEHDSDDEIETDDEGTNKEILDTPDPEESSDEEETKPVKLKEKKEPKETPVPTEDEVKRTLFVGNVPFSSKCKKEIKKIFSKHGEIETIRIRTVPVKDARVTPKLAVIREELHPERSTVNVYIKYKDLDSVDKALSENNTVLNENHLRVSRSDTTGSEHDPNCSVFVGNLPFALEDEALRATFDKCGEIESVRIIRDKKTNAGKGFGYVNFSSKDGVELALELTEEDLTIKNRILRVKRCTLTQNKQGTQPNRRGVGQNRGFDRTSQFRGGSHSQRGGFGNQRGGSGNQRGGFSSQRGGSSGHRGGYSNQRGGFDNQRGGFGNQRGGFNSQRGGSGGQRGGFGNQRGGFDNRRGGFGNHRGGFNSQRGGPGGQRGGFGNQRGGFNNHRGDFDKNDVNKFSENNSTQHDNDGALRRIFNKRKNTEGGDGPPNKKQNVNQPPKEKKTRKEFVGMTAEKKKKHKFDKGQKKKKQLSEILTK